MSGRSPSTPADRPGVRFHPPNRALMAKAPVTNLDPKTAILRAETWMGRHHAEFTRILDTQMGDLRRAFRAIGDTRGGEKAVAELGWMAHEIGGLGGTFGYGTLSEVCGMLCRFLENKKRLDMLDIEIVELHVNAIELAASKKLDGDTDYGKRIFDGLRQVVARDGG